MAQLPDELVQGLLDAIDVKGKLYAHAKARRARLEDLKGVTEAQLMKVIEACGQRSVAGQKRDARAHPTYLAVLEQLHDAIEDETLKQVAFQNAEREWESWRTTCANERSVR